MEWNDFVTNVQEWARERGIYEHSTALMQLYKAISEHGELVAVFDKDRSTFNDGAITLEEVVNE